MKTVIKQTVLMLIAVFAITSFMACSSKDDDDSNQKNYTYYINTTHMKLGNKAPCTLDQVAQEYQHAFDTQCNANICDKMSLQSAIMDVNRKQTTDGWTDYFSGYALIMCHNNNYPYENVPIYKFDFDENILTEIDPN